jgi:hypothetical protein
MGPPERQEAGGAADVSSVKQEARMAGPEAPTAQVAPRRPFKKGHRRLACRRDRSSSRIATSPPVLDPPSSHAAAPSPHRPSSSPPSEPSPNMDRHSSDDSTRDVLPRHHPITNPLQEKMPANPRLTTAGTVPTQRGPRWARWASVKVKNHCESCF